MVELESRRGDQPDIPIHYEGLQLKAVLQLAGWLVGAGLTGGGITLAVTREGSLFEPIGVVLATLGGALLVAMLRCRRFETILTANWLMAGIGPVRRRVLVNWISSIDSRPATSWRRAFAREEVTLSLTESPHRMTIPSNDKAELARSVDGAKAKS